MNDRKFLLRKEFQVIVPEGYSHRVQLRWFKRQYEKDFYFFRQEITDKNYSKVTGRFVPEEAYAIKLFQVEDATPEECLAFLKAEDAILVGAQGLSLVWELKKEEFPEESWVESFDEPSNLYHSLGDLVPAIGRLLGNWHFNYDFFWSQPYENRDKLFFFLCVLKS